MICQGFKPDPGNLAVRHYRGASRNVRHGETVNPSCNRKSGNGNPSPTAGRARSLSQPWAMEKAKRARRAETPKQTKPFPKVARVVPLSRPSRPRFHQHVGRVIGLLASQFRPTNRAWEGRYIKELYSCLASRLKRDKCLLGHSDRSSLATVDLHEIDAIFTTLWKHTPSLETRVTC